MWAWISKWFDQNTVSKICIIPHGKEYTVLSEAIDPVDIPHKYGGKFQFEFGMLPDLDPEIRDMVAWVDEDNGSTTQEMPKGPMRWVKREGGTKKTAMAVGTVSGTQRMSAVMALD